MKTFIVLVLTVTALFVWQRNSEPPAPARAPATRKAAAQTAEVNWPKNSLDQARRVVDQVRTLREQNEQR
jgi:hypothetical protein